MGAEELTMPFPKQDKHDFTVSKISTMEPNQAGVYGIFSHSGCIYLGTADDIRASLLQHVGRQSQQSGCIFEYQPQYWLAAVLEKKQVHTWERILWAEFEPFCEYQAISTRGKKIR